MSDYHKRISYSKTDIIVPEVEEYERFSEEKVPSHTHNTNYEDEGIRLSNITRIHTELPIIPVKELHYFNDKNVIVMEEKNILLDVKIGDKSAGDGWLKSILNLIYQYLNDHNYFYVDTVPDNSWFPSYAKICQASVETTKELIKDATKSCVDYSQAISDLKKIRDLCSEHKVYYQGSSIMLTLEPNDQGQVQLRAYLGDLAHPYKLTDDSPQKENHFYNGIRNLRHYLRDLQEEKQEKNYLATPAQSLTPSKSFQEAYKAEQSSSPEGKQR